MPSGIGSDVGLGDDYPPFDSDLSCKSVNVDNVFIIKNKCKKKKKKKI